MICDKNIGYCTSHYCIRYDDIKQHFESHGPNCKNPTITGNEDPHIKTRRVSACLPMDLGIYDEFYKIRRPSEMPKPRKPRKKK